MFQKPHSTAQHFIYGCKSASVMCIASCLRWPEMRDDKLRMVISTDALAGLSIYPQFSQLLEEILPAMRTHLHDCSQPTWRDDGRQIWKIARRCYSLGFLPCQKHEKLWNPTVPFFCCPEILLFGPEETSFESLKWFWAAGDQH